VTRQGITVLGSTGSIGESTLDVLLRYPDRFDVIALSAHANLDRLAQQCAQSRARYAVISDAGKAQELQTALDDVGSDAEIIAGEGALCSAVRLAETDVVMAAIVGAAGLAPTLEAVACGKRLLLANKESMVIAGELFRAAAAKTGTTIIPVDSEHNALFQVLPERFDDGLESAGVDKLVLTASGGPFLHRDRASLADVTPEQACAHPNWAMGRKISVDSATLVNKGLEVIEARWLFNAAPAQIEVVVHPQSIVHSMVAYRDGSMLAQLGMPDMRTPIAHALAWPERIEAGVERLHLTELGALEFYAPDLDAFPGLALAFQALEAGGGAPVVFNAANEVAVEAFLAGNIGFLQIAEVISAALDACVTGRAKTLEEVLEHDRLARATAGRVTETLADN
jgi:1-deoxy-D-xylulose-5-phosphate reductoisomerase